MIGPDICATVWHVDPPAFGRPYIVTREEWKTEAGNNGPVRHVYAWRDWATDELHEAPTAGGRLRRAYEAAADMYWRAYGRVAHWWSRP